LMNGVYQHVGNMSLIKDYCLLRGVNFSSLVLISIKQQCMTFVKWEMSINL
jgi:hypothetical protein